MIRTGAPLAAACLALIACREPAADRSFTAADHCTGLTGAVEIAATGDGGAQGLEIASPQVHAYSVELGQNAYLEATIDQHGVDLAVALLGVDGEVLLTVDALSGAEGPEKLPWIATQSGLHHLLVCAPSTGETDGRYDLRLVQRPAADAERKSVRAIRAFAAAEDLRRKDTDAEAAIVEYQAALELWKELEDPRRIEALYRLGQLSDIELDQPDLALGYFQSARELFGPDTAADIQAAILHGIGRCQFNLGEIEAARTAYELALERRREAGLISHQAVTANNLGLVLQILGDLPAALAAFDEAVAGWRQHGNRFQEAVSLHNRGRAYLDLGDSVQAQVDLERALAIQRGLRDVRREAATLNAIGIVRSRSRDLEGAQRFHQQALDLYRQAKDALGTALSLNNLGVVEEEQARAHAALQHFQQALDIYQELGDRRNQAISRLNIGRLLSTSDAERSLGALRLALPVFEEYDDTSHSTKCWLWMATAERHRGRLQAARELIEKALGEIESVRSGTFSQHLRSTLFATKQDYFDFYIDLLMELHRSDPDAGYHAEALAVSERARARSQLDAMLASGADAWPGLAADEGKRLQELQRQIRSLRLQRQSLDDEDAESRWRLMTSKLQELLRQFDLLRNEIRARGSAISDPVDPPLLDSEQIQSLVVDPQTLLIEYNLGRERSYLWAVTPDRIESFELPGQERIENLARRTYQLLATRGGRKLRAQTELTLQEASDLLIAPVAELLQDRRLLIVAEGALSFLPFGALPAPTVGENEADGLRTAQPLAASHEIVTVPSSSTLAVLRHNLAQRTPAPGTLAVIADPVFHRDDPRVEPRTNAGAEAPRFERLLHSRREARAILDLVGGPSKGTLAAFDFDADRSLVTSGQLAEFRRIHFATHGEIDLEHPDMSRLVFTSVDEQGRQRDGFLYAHQLYELDLPADLVVLSACRTAVGQEIRGEGLVGLTQGFFDAGAATVVVGLWNVEDQATAELMTYFYTGLLHRGLAPAAALREAQAEIRRTPKWQAPFYWAGFVLQGEWRAR